MFVIDSSSVCVCAGNYSDLHSHTEYLKECGAGELLCNQAIRFEVIVDRALVQMQVCAYMESVLINSFQKSFISQFLLPAVKCRNV